MEVWTIRSVVSVSLARPLAWCAGGTVLGMTWSLKAFNRDRTQ
jgi:hypothetical protein